MILLGATVPGTIQAATWVVQPDGSGDVASLQDAVLVAANGDTILLGPGTFAGIGNRGVFVQGKDLVFQSMSGAAATRIDCELSDRALLASDSDIGFAGITVTRGQSEQPGGAIFAVNSTTTLQDCWFQQNSGGGDVFTGGGGGAVHVSGGRLSVTGCRFEQNHASAEHGVGGGIAAVARADVTVENSVFEGNTTGSGQYSGGGGLYTWNAATLVVEQSAFQDNSTWEGAAVFAYADVTTLLGCTFSRNTSRYNVEIIGSASAEVTDCVFDTNTGGGLAFFTGGVATRCTFVGNMGSDLGGGAHANASVCSFVECTFAGNSSASAGGGLGILGGPPTSIDRCTFVDNHAPTGGHILARFTPVTLGRSILSGASGGAVVCEGNATVDASGCDVFGNAGGDYAGCLADQGATDGNFSADPGFCDEMNLDFTLRSDSPCAPPGVTGCGLVGAHPVACGPVSVEAASWGSLKSWYR